VLGYVNAVFELHHQITERHLPEPRLIFIPVGSLGTIAGIDLGLQLTGLSTRVRGICVSRHPPSSDRLINLIHHTLKLMQKSSEFQNFAYQPRFELITEYAGAGYGEPSAEGVEATQLANEHEILALDSTYTAKTLAGAISYIRKGGKGPILYWHTFNSVDLSPIANKIDYRNLPSPFHKFFTSAQLSH
jgi:D-cysteine desulfhydrase